MNSFALIWFGLLTTRMIAFFVSGGSVQRIVRSTQSGICANAHQSSESPGLKSVHVSPSIPFVTTHFLKSKRWQQILHFYSIKNWCVPSFFDIERKQITEYSQICAQRPTSGPQFCGRCWQVVVNFSLLIVCVNEVCNISNYFSFLMWSYDFHKWNKLVIVIEAHKMTAYFTFCAAFISLTEIYNVTTNIAFAVEVKFCCWNFLILIKINNMKN